MKITIYLLTAIQGTNLSASYAHSQDNTQYRLHPNLSHSTSHTKDRFVKNWDILLIKLLKECPSQKAILTGYPAGYELPNKITTDPRPPFLCIKGDYSLCCIAISRSPLSLFLHGLMISVSWSFPSAYRLWWRGNATVARKAAKQGPYKAFAIFILGLRFQLLTRACHQGSTLRPPSALFILWWRGKFAANVCAAGMLVWNTHTCVLFMYVSE